MKMIRIIVGAEKSAVVGNKNRLKIVFNCKETAATNAKCIIFMSAVRKRNAIF